MIRLILEKGEPAGAVFDLQDGEHFLGRGHKCSLRLKAEDVSREHAHLVVSGEEVKVENLGKGGTRVDGQPLQGMVAIADGQRLALGKQTVLRLVLNVGQDATSRGIAIGEPHSVEGGSLSPTAASLLSAAHPPTLKTPPSLIPGEGGRPHMTLPGAGNLDDEPVSSGTWNGGNSSEGGGGSTRAQRTRAVPQDVIEEARRELQRREKRRITLMVAIPLALLMVVAVAIWAWTPVPETEIVWPVDGAGLRIKGCEALNRGRKDGGYDVVYPLVPGAKIALVNGSKIITCLLGRKRDVPMRIVAREEVDEGYVRQDSDSMIRQWMEQVSQRDGKWSFDKPLPKTLFLGESFCENGIPFRFVSYEREEPNGRKWMGAASLFRHDTRFVSVCVELPSTERARAEGLLFGYYVDPSLEFVRSYWEGSSAEFKGQAAEVLSQLQSDLRRQAPSTWAGIEQQLYGVLRQSVVSRDELTRGEAMSLLLRLRMQESLWFNNQSIQITVATRSRDMGKIKQLAREAQGVFTNPNDWRFYECRRW